MREYDIVIIGGGPVGFAAAAATRNNRIESILILERSKELGGILSQCIHNGFGLRTFKKELTSPEHVARLEEQVCERKTGYKLNTMVMDISHDKVVMAMNKEERLSKIQTRVVILAMRCREHSRGVLNIPGYRPADIYCAGMIQHLVNMEGFMPGREVVALRSGDIDFVIVRCMTLKDVGVKVVAGLMPYSGESRRNAVQCLDDYGIPLGLSHTVADIRGKERSGGITLATVDEKGKPIPGTEEDHTYDTLFPSAGPIPENELSNGMGVKMNHVTLGPVANENLEANIEGVFICGNTLRVHDLMDFVSEGTATTGKNAVRYAKDGRCSETGQEIELSAVGGMHYTVPYVIRPDRMGETQIVCSHVGNAYRNCHIGVYPDDEQAVHRKRPATAPGEMGEIKFQKEKLVLYPGFKRITIKVEEA